ncbi:AI-2E family transporter [Salinigranum marinum]|uniref:AI-2E family transporter n=1 Tax=Salinigranum marinum TaxID=1515595 RepID=UPI002989E76F|nr:AI-2E family transporter [Salinigranum marinum]
MSTVDFDRYRTGLWLVTAVVFAGLVYVGWRYVGTVVLVVFVYYVTRPVFGRIHRHVPSRTVAVAVSLVSVALPVLLLVGWTLVVVFLSLAEFLTPVPDAQFVVLVDSSVDASAVATQLNGFVQDVLSRPARLRSLDVGPVFAGATDVVASSVRVLFNVALHGFVVLLVVFYLLRDGGRLVGVVRTTVPGDGDLVEPYIVAVDRDLESVYFGTILRALVTGVVAAVTFLLLDAVAPATVRIPQPALAGVAAGIARLVPVVGSKLVTVPVTLLLIVRGVQDAPEALWFPVLFAVVSVAVVDAVPDRLLRPYVGERTLHAGAVMLSYVLGLLLFGWYGVLLGPLVLALTVEFGRLVAPALVDPTASVALPSPGSAPSAATDEHGVDTEADADDQESGGAGDSSDADGSSTDSDPSGRA